MHTNRKHLFALAAFITFSLQAADNAQLPSLTNPPTPAESARQPESWVTPKPATPPLAPIRVIVFAHACMGNLDDRSPLNSPRTKHTPQSPRCP